MKPPRLDLLLLDFDGVLAEYARPLRCAHLAEHAGCEAGHVHDALFESGLETAYDTGQIDSDAYLAQLGQALQAPIDAETWLQARVAACRADPRVLDMVSEVASRVPIAVLTNNGPLMAQAVARIVPSLFPALQDRVLCSGALGGRKPQPEVYLRALGRLQAQPRTTLFLDDLFVNVRGAREQGLHADTVTGAGSMRRVLRRYGLL